VNGFFVCHYPSNSVEPQHYLEDLAEFYRILAEHKVVFSVNTDAHRPEQLDFLKATYHFIREIGLGGVEFWTPVKKDR